MGSAAVGCEAGPVAAESTHRWKMGGRGAWPGPQAGSRETGLPERVVRRVLSGALEASPWQGLPAFPVSQAAGWAGCWQIDLLDLHLSLGTKVEGAVMGLQEAQTGHWVRLTESAFTFLSLSFPVYRPEILSARPPHGGSSAEMNMRRL